MPEILSRTRDAIAGSKMAGRGRDERRAHLPVLLVPGFMSSGITIEKSGLRESWEGKRLWLDPAALGLQKFYHAGEEGGAQGGDRPAGPRRRTGSRRSALERGDGRRRFSLADLEGGVDSDSDDDDSEPEDGEAGEDAAGGDDEARPILGGDGAGGGDPPPAGGKKSQHAVTRNLWIRHMSLSPGDLTSDPPDVRVRPVEGLEGIEYLAPGALTGPLSYVYAPAVKALERHGYRGGHDLEAAPYDWRLAPRHLEERDGYFARTMRKVEALRENTGLPVVIVAHSLGTKVVEYLLAFAHARDPTWCDKYVHTYMPVGGVHLGAPFTLRTLITSNQMGLEVFFDQSEGLAMARSLGSIPWMIPTDMPPLSPENAFVRREGAFEIRVDDTIDAAPFFERRLDSAKPTKLKLELRYGRRTLRSKFSPVVDGKVRLRGDFVFATGPEGPYEGRSLGWCCTCCVLRCACCACCSNDRLIVSVLEPGYQMARRTKDGTERQKRWWSVNNKCRCLKILTCWWIIKYVLLLFGFLVWLVTFGLWLAIADGISRLCGGSSQLAVSEPLELLHVLDEAEARDVDVELRDDRKRSACCRKGGEMPSIRMTVRWAPPLAPEEASPGCRLAELTANRYMNIDDMECRENRRNWDYKGMSGSGMLQRELGRDAPLLRAVEELYGADPLCPRSLGPPPVKNVKAVYGINLPTEVGAVYKRRPAVALRRHKVKPVHELDEDARFRPRHGYVLDDGVLWETRDTPQVIQGEGRTVKCSGDATVPYWSLQHVRSWGDRCNVMVSELDGAAHRAILGDKRFHDILVDYVTSGSDDHV